MKFIKIIFNRLQQSNGDFGILSDCKKTIVQISHNPMREENYIIVIFPVIDDVLGCDVGVEDGFDHDHSDTPGDYQYDCRRRSD